MFPDTHGTRDIRRLEHQCRAEMLMRNGRNFADQSILVLLHKATQHADGVFQRITRGKLTPSQFVVLEHVNELGAASQADLVRRSGIDRSTIGLIVLRLISRGLLTRSKSTQDARRYVVTATPAGEQLLQAMSPNAYNADRMILRNLNRDEAALLRDVLEKLLSGPVDRHPRSDAPATKNGSSAPH